MPVDGTFELLAGLQEKNKAVFSFMRAPLYNIDDMDSRECMISMKFSGCFCLMSSLDIDPGLPGMIYINGKATEAPLIASSMPMFGHMVGIHVRKYLTEYDRAYEIRYEGAVDMDGQEIPEFCFTLMTTPRMNPGVQYPKHDELVLQAAREGAVLLKNNDRALPLQRGKIVNLFGAGAIVFRLGCLGAGKINPRYGIGVREGIEKYTSMKINEELYQFYTDEKDIFPPEEIVERAKEMSDTAVVFITRGSSEAHDMPKGKGGYLLKDEERNLLRQVSSAFDKTIAILNTAYPIETAWAEEYGIAALLWMGLPGMAGGRALAELLEGSVCPSGKLPNTWAKAYKDYPSAVNFLTKEDIRKKYGNTPVQFITTVYEEGLYVGYRYFTTFGKKAAYLFGHGLSYTTYKKEVKKDERKDCCEKTFTVEVTNTGSVSGKETVLLYASFEGGKLEQPAKRLVAFSKTKELAPGESENLILNVEESCLKSYDDTDAAWIIEAGRITFHLGGTPEEAIAVSTLTIPEKILVQQVQNRIVPPISIRELSQTDTVGTYPKGEGTKAWTLEECEGKLPFKRDKAASPAIETLQQKSDQLICFADVVEYPALAEDFVAQLSNWELARLCVGGRTGWGLEDNGFAGTLYNDGAIKKYEIPNYYFADGNNGLNMFESNIGFPVSTVVCATFNAQLSYEEGLAIAEEARGMNLHCILAPAMNLQRNPLCGRHCEYFSEDPLLAGRMAGQESRGLEDGGVSSCVKHFFANNAETMRNNNHSLMTERTARELYLRAFEYAFKVNIPDSVMTGYNAANGIYCADDEELLRGILREEFGFTGYVMTDWNGYGDEGLAAALAAGICWLAPGSTEEAFVKPIETALEEGKLSRGIVQKNLVELIKIITR